MDDSLNFSLAPLEVPVTLDGKPYVLRELSEGGFCQWRDFMLRATKPGLDGKPTTMEGTSGADALIVSLCLFDTDGKAVPRDAIVKWPSRVVQSLDAKAREISGLNAPAEGPEKNVPSSTPEPPLNGTPPTSGSRTMWEEPSAKSSVGLAP